MHSSPSRTLRSLIIGWILLVAFTAQIVGAPTKNKCHSHPQKGPVYDSPSQSYVVPETLPETTPAAVAVSTQSYDEPPTGSYSYESDAPHTQVIPTDNETYTTPAYVGQKPTVTVTVPSESTEVEATNEESSSSVESETIVEDTSTPYTTTTTEQGYVKPTAASETSTDVTSVEATSVEATSVDATSSTPYVKYTTATTKKGYVKFTVTSETSTETTSTEATSTQSTEATSSVDETSTST